MRFSLLISILCLVGHISVYGQQVYQSDNGYAEFQSEVPLHSFTGSSNHLVGRINLADSTVDFYLDLATLDTGNSKRDKDMRQTLEVDTYPFAEFFGKLVTDFDSEADSAQLVTVSGEFKIHNVAHQVELKGMLQRMQNGLKVEADWTLDMTDYKIRPPGILFYRVDEQIDIRIETILKPISKQSLIENE